MKAGFKRMLLAAALAVSLPVLAQYPNKPIKLVVPVGFVMLALQGVSEVIKRVAALLGVVTIDATYERPTQ